MKHVFKHLGHFSAVFATVFGVSAASGVQAPNPRSSIITNTTQRADGRTINRGDSDASQVVNMSARTAARRAMPAGQSRSGVTTQSERSAVRQTPVAVNRAESVRAAAVSHARSAAVNSPRVTSNVSNAGLSRAATTARATAVFNDVSKIGGGYAACREAYATCMDQFCANANDTYRRCYCSDRFVDFRDIEYALDEAKTLLMQFEDNNLNAVDKTADEVNAMYSATVGEAAIKKDTSAAQSILNEIGSLLSGKKKATSTNNSSTSLGIMSLDFSADIGDVWGDGTTSSIFDTSTGVDLTSLEGTDLYNASNKQCLQLIQEQCENKAVLNMATSAYGILITQDCNAYEKNINAKREGVKQTVRQAEKILRDARLEEYRSHNSADVNECISKVKTALTADVACGANYKRCLDYSGAYVNQTTGEAIYSPRLFELEGLIKLDGTEDVLGKNGKFNAFLDTKRMFANSALDTCRDMSEIVWEEFKRTALIEIAQAQDEKIEEVKNSCVNTMAECYDTQSNALKNFDTTTAKSAGAISAYAARDMCREKVTACAALYGNNTGTACTFDENGHVKDASTCGLTSLLAFVDTVDNVRIAEGCVTAIENYAEDLCTPSTGDMGYPWNCRKLKSMATGSTDDAKMGDKKSIEGLLMSYAYDNCADPTKKSADNPPSYGDALIAKTKNQVQRSVEIVTDLLQSQLEETCESLDGYWLDDIADINEGEELLKAFYTTVYGTSKEDDEAVVTAKTWGACVQNTVKLRCLEFNIESASSSDSADGEAVVNGEVMAEYDENKNECVFTEAWYKKQCAKLGNTFWEEGVCFFKP